jgi:(p)ppGpp synthase/HD superfamily hydrolase
MPEPLGPRFSSALTLAADLHRNQVRKGTETPYMAHLLAVTALVLEHGGDEDAAIAALLHDAVEDAGGQATLRRIRLLFGDSVAEVVMECSDADVTPKPPWHDRKRAYIRSISHKSERALLVSMADKVHNARAIVADHEEHGDALWDRFNASPEDIVWYYSSLAEAFQARAPNRLWRALRDEVREMESLVGAG